MGKSEKYILFLDESGIDNLDVTRPRDYLLGIGGILIEEEYYNNHAVEEIKKFKKRIFGDEDIVLHSYHVRYKLNEFECLKDETLCAQFKDEFAKLIDGLEFRVVTRIIDKKRLRDKYKSPFPPYQLALGLIADSLSMIMYRLNGIAQIVLEQREKKKDREIKHAYAEVLKTGNSWARYFVSPAQLQTTLESQLIFLRKKDHCHGLQMSDFVIYTVTSAHQNSNFKRRDYVEWQRKFDELHGCKLFP
jgi:hypothetical protein